jgi:hypothetical protein
VVCAVWAPTPQQVRGRSGRRGVHLLTVPRALCPTLMKLNWCVCQVSSDRGYVS